MLDRSRGFLPLVFGPNHARLPWCPESANSMKSPEQPLGTAPRKLRWSIGICRSSFASVTGCLETEVKQRTSHRRRFFAPGRYFQSGSQRQNSRPGPVRSRLIYAGIDCAKRNPFSWRLYQSGSIQICALKKPWLQPRQAPTSRRKLPVFRIASVWQSISVRLRVWAISRRPRQWRSAYMPSRACSHVPAEHFAQRLQRTWSHDE